MTAHSERGQGGQPLYEGVVLPANGDPWTPEQQRQVDDAERRPAPGSPPAGQPWGDPWGPQSAAAATPEDAAGTLPPPPVTGPAAPPVSAGSAAPAGPAAPPEPGGQPLPGTAPHQAVSAPASPAAEIPSGPPTPPMPTSPPPAAPPSSPAPEPGGQPLPGTSAETPTGVPAGGGRHRGGPAAAEPGPVMPPPAQQGPQTLPPQQAPQSQQAPPPQPQQAAAAPQSAHGAAPVSPTDATAYIPPVTDGPAPPGGFPQPGSDADPTQMLPPQTGAAPVPGPAGNPEETAQLRTPLPPEAGPGAANGAAPQPPAGFESLFRAEPGAPADSPGTTQSLPFFDSAAGRQRTNDGVGGLGKTGGPAAPYGQQQTAPSAGAHRPQGRAARRNAERSTLSRISPPVLIGVGVAVVAGLGMALGAALTSGDDEKKADGKPRTGSSAEPAARKSASADPAEPQAKELDKLLAASNDSRAQVIRAVESIKVCKRLRQSAADLKDAAGQRNSLVTRLGQLETDKISGSSQLNSALTRAWKASASADNHYAAWAGEAAAKKGKVCHKGKARPTRHTALAARVSGEATTAKKQAAGLWNPTAKKYGLKERAFGDL